MPDPITGIVAGTSLLGAGMSSRASSKATSAASKSEAASLAFEQQKYDDWQEVYGPIQKNLGDYYSNLTPEYYESKGLEAFETEKAAAMQSLTETLAQRGIDDSGIAAGMFQDMELDAAQTRAGIRADAERMMVEDKSRFLQIGLGQNPDESMSRTLANQAAGARSRANQAQATAGQALGSAITTGGTAIADYYRNQPQTPPPATDTSKIGII